MIQSANINKDIAKRSITGLVLMTTFTLMWSGVAYYGLMKTSYWWAVSIFPIASIFFIYYAIQMLKVAKHLPMAEAEDRDLAKKKGRIFGIICTGEGIGIAILVNLVTMLHHPELRVPAIALAVGLHFFPLGMLFKRKMDYYLGIWSTGIALLAIFLTLDHELTKTMMMAFTGIGLALATTYYGVHMVFAARRALAI